MTARLAFLFLPHGDLSQLEATLESVASEAAESVEFFGLAGGRLTSEALSRAGIKELRGIASFGDADLIAPIRAGDRLIPGALAARALTFSAFPAGGISIAGHSIRDTDGETLRVAGPPKAGFEPGDLLLGPRIEPAAVLIRKSSLSDSHLGLLRNQHGDAIVWSRIADEDGYHLSGEIAASVALDQERHGNGRAAGVSSLIGTVREMHAPEGPGHATARRELLRRLYLEPGPEPPEPPDLAKLFVGKLADAESAAAVIDDLQWLAERQAESLRLERLSWADGQVAETDMPPLTVSEEILQARAQLGEMGAKSARLNTAISRLHNQLYHRDTVIARLSDTALPEAVAMAEAESETDQEDQSL